MNRDGYRDQIVTHDVGVSLHSKTHPLFMKYSNGTSTVLYISLSELVSCAFSTIPMSLFNFKNFSFTCIYIVRCYEAIFIFQHMYCVLCALVIGNDAPFLCLQHINVSAQSLMHVHQSLQGTR